jgi:hypothetical protein
MQLFQRAAGLHGSALSVTLRACLRRKEEDFSFAYPALIPQRANARPRNVPGYYRSSLSELMIFANLYLSDCLTQ